VTLPRKIPVAVHSRLDPDGIVESLATFGVVLIDRGGFGQAELNRLRALARTYFEQPDRVKRSDAMSNHGAAWRGWFGVGDELTSGQPDAKEGFYFGSDLPAHDPRVVCGRPMHGPNPEPTGVPELRAAVEDWMSLATSIGLDVLSAVAMGLGLPGHWFASNWCRDPTVLFRIFRYPAAGDSAEVSEGVGPHTDYGLLTVLAHDGVPGLEVEIDGSWVAMPSDPELLIVNAGDMLERATAGRLRSTVHRVVSPERHRYSFPLFLDPAWDAVVQPLPGFDLEPLDEPGTYGSYLLDKVSRVFPELFRDQFGTGR
jgi:isopenicillin N synthase-like dioxygenase